MKKYLVVTAAALAVGFSATQAAAQFHAVTDSCGFEHPQKAKQLKSSMVQAFVSCGNAGGNTPNSMTESGVPTCAPPETFREESGSPPNGWSWDELKGKADVAVKAAKNKRTTPASLAAMGDSADVDISLKAKGILEASGPASGTGSLATLSRATLRDRNNTPGNNADDIPMTVIDFPVQFAAVASAGQIKLKTTANAAVEVLTGRPLPKCTSIEVVDISLTDENGDTFARLGVLLPQK